MSNSYKVLILLIAFFGFSISYASPTDVVSFGPQTVKVYPDPSQDVQIRMIE